MKTLALSFAVFALFSSVATADMPPTPPPPPAKTCVADKPCPVVAPPAACKKDEPAAMSITDVVKGQSALIGKSVRIVGKLQKDWPVCTELECLPDVRCCNKCGSKVFLSNDKLGGERIDIAGGSPYACGGDDTGVCCGVALGGPVVITGTLTRPNGILTITPAASCTP